ncbi:MAG: hypothetical protein AAF721_38270 [Myxococcota bacterium]
MHHHRALSPHAALFGLVALTLGCGDDGPPTGSAQGACYPNATCNADLRCEEGICTPPGGGGSDGGQDGGESAGDAGDDGADSGVDPACQNAFETCVADMGVDQLLPCVHEYTVCRFDVAPSCAERVQACEELGAVMECAQGWPGCFDGGDAGDDGGVDDGVDDGGVDDGVDDGLDGGLDDGADDGEVCAPPACDVHVTKMMSCYPSLSTDWYTSCLDIYDICDIGGFCFEGTPAIIACMNSRPCEEVVDGACLQREDTC